MAKMGGFRSPKGVKQPSLKSPMNAPSKPGMALNTPVGGMNTAPNIGFKKGGLAKKMVGGKRKKK